MKRRITIKDVAKASGVSLSTVGDILRNRPARYKQETIDKVKSVATELGYTPNAFAAGLRKKNFQSIAMIQKTGTRTASIITGLLLGIDEVLTKHNYNFSLHFTPTNDNNPDYLKTAMHDGIFINNGIPLSEDLLARAKKQHIPIIELNVKANANCIYPDDYEAAARGTEHLINLEHTNIMYTLTSPVDNNIPKHYSVLDRKDGYCYAMEKAGLAPQVYQFPVDAITVESAEKTFYDILSHKNRPTAFVIYHYGNAISFIGLINAAKKLNLSIPKDISVFTFKGDKEPNNTNLQIAKMFIDWFDIGLKSADMMLEKIKTQKDIPPRKIRLEFDKGNTIARCKQ